MSQPTGPHTMSVTARTYLTAGMAALGVGALALTSVQPLPSQAAVVPQRVVSDMAVSLAAAVDPIQAWVNVFENSAANLGILAEFYLEKPFPLLQTVGANLQTYADQLANGQGNLIPGQIWNNIQTFFNAPWDPGATVTFVPEWNTEGCPATPCTVTQPFTFPTGTGDPTTSDTLPFKRPEADQTVSPREFLLQPAQLIAGVAVREVDSYGDLPEGDKQIWDAALQATSVWVLSATPASGQLVALLGPAIAPLVQLTRSFTAVGEAFQNGEALDALYELINIPANMTNAFLNGLDTPWDLTGILSNFLPLPEGLRLGIQLGGLLNTMPFNGSLNDPDNPPTEYSGGTLWDNLSIIAAPEGLEFLIQNNAYGLKNGWGGSVVGLGQLLADRLLVTPPEPEEAAAPAAAAAAPAPAAAAVGAPVEAPAAEVADAVAEESVPAVVEEDLAELAPAVEENAEAAAVEASEPAPKATAATGDASDGGNTGRAARAGRGAR